MPCFLFTYHGYGTWLPDRPEGFVHWRDGLLPTDEELASAYKRKMKVAKGDSAAFEGQTQLLLIDELVKAAEFQKLRIHAVATEPTHVHAIVSWPDERTPQHVSDGLRESLSRRLNKEVAKRKWLAKGANKRRMKDQVHFDYLTTTYLPSHVGWKWEEGRGVYR
ncbi:MAG TPA: hypothetical protein VF175_12205 [Lacipirellula sp.]